jgi:hypothetical protein
VVALRVCWFIASELPLDLYLLTFFHFENQNLLDMPAIAVLRHAATAVAVAACLPMVALNPENPGEHPALSFLMAIGLQTI